MFTMQKTRLMECVTPFASGDYGTFHAFQVFKFVGEPPSDVRELFRPFTGEPPARVPRLDWPGMIERAKQRAKPRPAPPDAARLTRSELCARLGWSPEQLTLARESLLFPRPESSRVVRGQFDGYEQPITEPQWHWGSVMRWLDALQTVGAGRVAEIRR